MATEFSFDVVSKVDLLEVKNAIDQAEKEIASRYDFRESKSTITLDGNDIKLMSDDEFHLTTLIEVLRGKMAKRNISLKALEYSKIEAGTRGTARQTITLKQGIPTEEAKKLVKLIKDAGIKVNAQIQGEQLRVVGKDKDSLQAVQKLIRSQEDLPYDAEFSNYR